MAKLTKAQRRVLGNIPQQGLAKHFDVWVGGYWKQGVSVISGRTGEILAERGLVTLEPEQRMYSGHRCQVAALTDLGRAALAEEKGE